MLKKIFLYLAILIAGIVHSYAQTTFSATSNGTWTCPTGVTTITVQCWGGGGAGGGGNSASNKNGGGGGGGGAFTINTVVAVTPSTVYNYTVGGAGSGGSGDGGPGGSTIGVFGSTTVTANGGAGGKGWVSGGGAGGPGGAAGTFTGGTGANGSNTYGGGGAGGAGSTGNGSNASTSTQGAAKTVNGGSGGSGSTSNNNDGNNGNTYGGGGGGGTKNSDGGDGAGGLFTILYCLPPTVTTQPASFTTTTSNASFSVAASGGSPYTYQWQSSVDGGITFTNITSTTQDFGVTYGSGTTATLTLSSIICSANGYQYKCTINNCGGSVTSGIAKLTYSVPITIATQPAAYTTQSVAEFSVVATTPGGDNFTYQWQRSTNGTTWVNITASGMDAGVTYSNYTTSVLELMSVTNTVNNYKYRCVVSNDCGIGATTTSSAATLTYGACAVTIVAQPASTRVIYSGSGAIFHVNNTNGSGFLWQRSADGGSTWTDISSSTMDYGVTYNNYTTATLDLTNITNSVNGYKFRCVVTSASSNCSVTTDGAATLTYAASGTCGTQYSRQIQIYKNIVSGGANLSNFPFLINVTDANLKAHVANANGYDILFTDANGTPLYFELESYNASTGALIAWVNVPTVSSTTTTTMYMYYGNSSASTNPSSTQTWDTNYVAVYHFNNYSDATSNAISGINNGTSITTGTISSGVSGFNSISAAGGRSSVFNSLVQQQITVSAWAKFGTAGLDQKIAGSEDNANGGWKMGVFSDNTLEFELRDASNNPTLNRSSGSPTTLSTGTWYHTAGQYSYSPSSGFIKTYVNGSLDRGTYSTATLMGVSQGTLSIGCEAFAPTTANWSGTLDELHISKCIRSAGWIATEYNNQKAVQSATTYSLLAESASTNSVTGNWSAVATWIGGIPGATANVNINIGTVTVDANETVTTLNVVAGATLNIASGKTLSVSSFVMNCGTITGPGTLIMNGTSSNQNISGTGTYTIGNLTINNTSVTSPTITLQAPIYLTGTLTLTKGVINTDATNILTMLTGSSAPVLTAASTSYINGPMQWQLASASTSTLNVPIGVGTDCRPAQLVLTHTSATPYNYVCQVFSADPWVATASTATDMPASVDTVSAIHYWKIDRKTSAGVSAPSTGLNGNQQISLYFGNTGNDDNVFSANSLTIVKTSSVNDAPPWVDIGGTPSFATNNSPTSLSGFVTSTSSPGTFNSFSIFTLGSKLTGGSNPLPIELLSFSAVANENKVDLKWETITETNNAYFTVEKSKDGINFTKVINVTGAGNSTTYRDYAEADFQPYEGTSYYRLKQTDKNGAFAYFNIVPVNFVARKNILVYPNPITSTTNLNVQLTGFENEEVVVVLRDVQGREFASKVLLTTQNNDVFVVDEAKSLPPGTYIVTATSNDKIYNYKIIVR